MPNFYNDLFKLLLISDDEPVLLMGPSSYKTELSEYYIKKIKKKNLKKFYLIKRQQSKNYLAILNFYLKKGLNSFFMIYCMK